jgi:hypothetical protein
MGDNDHKITDYTDSAANAPDAAALDKGKGKAADHPAQDMNMEEDDDDSSDEDEDLVRCCYPALSADGDMELTGRAYRVVKVIPSGLVTVAADIPLIKKQPAMVSCAQCYQNETD